jgi:hypothetical protein
VFTPGASTDEIVDFLRTAVDQRHTLAASTPD